VDVPFTSNADARFWLPGTTTTLSVTLDEVPQGSYDLALALPSVDAQTAADPRFAVQTANVGTWNAAAGTNALAQSVVVSAAAVVPAALPTVPTPATRAAASGVSLAATGRAVDPAGLIGTGAATLAVLALGAALVASRRRA
jgi:hypothetical protein